MQKQTALVPPLLKLRRVKGDCAAEKSLGGDSGRGVVTMYMNLNRSCGKIGRSWFWQGKKIRIINFKK